MTRERVGPAIPMDYIRHASGVFGHSFLPRQEANHTMIRRSVVAVVLLVVLACRGEGEVEPGEPAPPAGADTVDTASRPAVGAIPEPEADAAPTEGSESDEAVAAVGVDTTATTPDTVAGTTEELPPVPSATAPAPPGGYAVETRPAQGGKLAKIEYASPKTVREVARFYESQFRFPRRVVLDIMGDDIVAYGLTASTTIGPSTMPQDVERLIDQRTEPLLVVSPWTMHRNDPLIRDLREAGQDAQANALLQTRSKVTVVSRPPERPVTESS